ncbi:MAG: amidohydrolase family protein [Armatimonadetes bacterium]|nr:amidohydrolase family protein [Armatimonadota bacterium]
MRYAPRRSSSGAAVLMFLLLSGALGAAAPPAPPSLPEGPILDGNVIDTHNHLEGRTPSRQGPPAHDYEGAARVALDMMNRVGIKKMLIMPPPFPPGFPGAYDLDDLLGTVRRYPDRFAVLGGGGTLNPLIHQAVRSGDSGAGMRARLEREAAEILAKGALGFGELTAEHVSKASNHPYLAAPPDHPLFLALADIAAQRDVPIDIHMEAVPEDMALPGRLTSPLNPRQLRANIAAFERLLAHNRRAKIIWAHAGWDNTGHRTARLSADLLQKHPNLYMSIKIGGDAGPDNRPMGPPGIAPEWLEVIKAFPERFLTGSDQFYLSPRSQQRFPRHVEASIRFLSLLPPELARRVGYENARRLFKLGE